MILVTGATGQLGTATLDFLLKKQPAAQLAGLARDPAKAAAHQAQGVAIRRGDYGDYDSLVAAFGGVDRLFLISSSNQEGKIAEHHRNAVRAAVAAGVGHIFYTIGDLREPHSPALRWRQGSHEQTLALLQASGIPFTLLQTSLYAEVIPIYLGRDVLTRGVTFPAGQGRVPFARRPDMAEAAATLLAHAGPLRPRYVLAGDEAHSYADIAQMLTELCGSDVPYHDLAPAAYHAQLVAGGLPPHVATILTSFGEATAAGDFDTGHTDLPELLGRRPAPLRDYLRDVYFPAK